MNFEFGIKTLTTQGVKSDYREPDMTLRLFVSVQTTEKGKEKGKFQLTDGAMELLNLKPGDHIAFANSGEETSKNFHLANVTGIDGADPDGKVSGLGTFYNLKLVKILQKFGWLPENLGEEPVILDVIKVNETPPVVACSMRTADTAKPYVNETMPADRPFPDNLEDDEPVYDGEPEFPKEPEVEYPEEEDAFEDLDNQLI